MQSFSELGLAAPLLQALDGEGYTQPTPIQLKAIPDVLAGRDLQGIAQTGTGKTAAFALPILQRLAESPSRAQPRQCRALVLSPTRELASQILDSFRAYGRHLRLSATVVFGGVPIGRQQRTLAGGVDILVATPGRLLDLVDQRSLSLAGVEILVLDEADQMLDLGFIHALKRVVTLVPRQRQTLFFSATMPKAIEQLSAQFIADPVKVSVAPAATTVERVDQSVIFVSTGEKPALLRAVLADDTIDRVLVFTRTKHGADRVVKQLGQGAISAAAIHGNKSQGQRERALADFRAGRCRVLVATDIAARGIDVEGVSHVVNFDLPNVPESYVHRIGRTARAGAAGQAISFCNGEEREYLRDIEKLTRLKLPVAEPPAGFAAAQAAIRSEPALARSVENRPSQPHRHGQGQRHPAASRSSNGQPPRGGQAQRNAPAQRGAQPPRGQAQPSRGPQPHAQRGGGGAAHGQGGRGRPAGSRPAADRASDRSEGPGLAWLDRGRP